MIDRSSIFWDIGCTLLFGCFALRSTYPSAELFGKAFSLFILYMIMRHERYPFVLCFTFAFAFLLDMELIHPPTFC
jgi:hypothetical protein